MQPNFKVIRHVGLKVCVQTCEAGLKVCMQNCETRLKVWMQTCEGRLKVCAQTCEGGLKVCAKTCEAGLKVCKQICALWHTRKHLHANGGASLHSNLRGGVESLPANLRGEVESLHANLRGGVEIIIFLSQIRNYLLGRKWPNLIYWVRVFQIHIHIYTRSFKDQKNCRSSEKKLFFSRKTGFL